MKRLSLGIVVVVCLLSGMALASPFVTAQKEARPIVPDNGDEKGLLNCAGMTEVTLGTTLAGTNVGAVNNVSTYLNSSGSTLNSGCTGGEVVYHLVVPSPVKWRIDLTGMTCDLDLMVLSACDENLTLAASAGTASEAIYTTVPLAGEWWVVVDGYSGANCAYNIAFMETPPVNFCALVTPLDCTDQALSGDTTNGQNLLSAEPAACTGYTEAGREHYYAITLNPGGNFAASVTLVNKDAAIYVMDSCVEPFNCLVGADDTFTNQAETLAYSNDTTEVQTVYLVIDGYGSTGYGPYTGTFTCTPGVISVDQSTWGSLKAQYK